MAKMTLRCEPFPNSFVTATARRIGRGELAGAYRGIVVTWEQTGLTKPFVTRFHSQCARMTRADAMADAEQAARQAAQTGYVPRF